MANITSVFDKVRLCKGAWSSNTVEHSILSDHRGKNHEAYYGNGRDVKYDEAECEGVCAEGAIEWALGMSSHNDSYIFDDWGHSSSFAADSVDWFRDILRRVTLYFATQYLKEWARAKRGEVVESIAKAGTVNLDNINSDTLRNRDIEYWNRVMNDDIPQFNDDVCTTEVSVREFLFSLEDQYTYRELEKHCRLTNEKLEVLRKGYVEALRNQNIGKDIISQEFPSWHFDQLRTANVI